MTIKKRIEEVFQDSDYYLITIVAFTYQKSSTSESASATRASSHSRISCLSAACFDFQRRFFEGHDSSSINSTSRVANSTSHAPSDTVKLWCPQFSLHIHEQYHHPHVFPRIHHIVECGLTLYTTHQFFILS
jgi:hypothetical protein